jgi:adenine-specific DNA-methyltransferase
MDEVFGSENHVSDITLKKTAGQDEALLNNVSDYILFYARDRRQVKYRPVFGKRVFTASEAGQYNRVRESESGLDRPLHDTDFDKFGQPTFRGRAWTSDNATSSGHGGNAVFGIFHQGVEIYPTKGRHWSSHAAGMARLDKAGRLVASNSGVRYARFFDDFTAFGITNIWSDFGGASEKRYVVETSPRAIERCILMASDPGDLILDPTCGSGTTAYVSEQWGRRWITIDTSRVALALARARIMGARYPYYLLADSPEGQLKEAEITRGVPSSLPTRGNIRQGFVYERVPHVTLKSIANNAEIDVIWDTWQKKLEPLREALNTALKKDWQDWQIPREADAKWNDKAKKLHADWWAACIGRQREIDASIAAKAESEYLYDKPYEDKKRVRVAGPFTVDSLSPHRTLAMDIDDGLIDGVRQSKAEYEAKADFASVMLENLKAAGVQQAHKADRISFTSIVGWPGEYVCAEGRYIARRQLS